MIKLFDDSNVNDLPNLNFETKKNLTGRESIPPFKLVCSHFKPFDFISKFYLYLILAPSTILGKKYKMYVSNLIFNFFVYFQELLEDDDDFEVAEPSLELSGTHA